MQQLPYGSWPSPISVDAMLAAGASLRDARADRLSSSDAGTLTWMVSVPEQNARSTLIQRDLATGSETELTASPIDVSSRVQEYGGGAWDVRDGVVVACDGSTGTVRVVSENPDRAMTPASAEVRFGDLRVHPALDLVLAVREDHRGRGEPVTTLVALQLSGDNPDFGTVLASGSDFYAGPELSGDSRLAWCQWQHPNMPWDATQILVAPLSTTDAGDWQLGKPVQITGPDEAAIHPCWLPRSGDQPSELIYATDTSGVWSLVRWRPDLGVRPCHRTVGDVDRAPWVLGRGPWAVLDADRVALRWLADGMAHLGVLTLSTGLIDEKVVTNLSEIEAVTALPPAANDQHSDAEDRAVRWFAVLDYTDRSTDICELTGPVTVVVPAPTAAPDPSTVSIPRSLTIEGQAGSFQAWYYPPYLAGVRALDGELPPLIVRSHGGPTAFAESSYSVAIQFWTSRGFAVIDVNYSGSSGFGRAYRQRLNRSWGILDVADCASAVRYCIDQGLADPVRVAITGGSAGGYTTLQSLVSTQLYTAGVSRYGIGDLMALATDTHKFESRYLDSLIGPLPADEAVYHARSPIEHLDNLATPMLILQGAEDAVVPPNQAEAMAAAVNAKGLPVALQIYPGERHGFRQLVNRRAALEAELSFLTQLWSIDPADHLPTLVINNLR